MPTNPTPNLPEGVVETSRDAEPGNVGTQGDAPRSDDCSAVTSGKAGAEGVVAHSVPRNTRGPAGMASAYVESIAKAMIVWSQPHLKHSVAFSTLCEAIEKAIQDYPPSSGVEAEEQRREPMVEVTQADQKAANAWTRDHTVTRGSAPLSLVQAFARHRILAEEVARVSAAMQGERPPANIETVEFVRYWMMSSDHPTTAWEREFAASMDARHRLATTPPQDGAGERLLEDRYGETALDRIADHAENGTMAPQFRADLKALLALVTPTASTDALRKALVGMLSMHGSDLEEQAARDIARAALASHPPQDAAGDMALVPREPTEAMLAAGAQEQTGIAALRMTWPEVTGNIWSAMLTASESAGTSGEGAK